MGESRYHTAHGTRPQGGQGHDAWYTQEAGVAGGYPEAQAWPHQSWHDSDLHDPYSAAMHPKPHAAQTGYRVQPPLTAYPDGRGGYGRPAAATDPAIDPAASGYAHGGYAPFHPVSHAPSHAPGHARAAEPAQASRPAAPPLSAGGLAQGVGAVLSLLLLVGGGVWTFQMMQRDVSGVPVVRALEGPLRVAPEDPGGAQAAHQGLSVTELAADGASSIPDEIVLAPPPLDLDRDLTSPARGPSAGGPALVDDAQLIEIGLPMSTPPSGQAEPLGLVQPNRFAVTRSPRPAPRGASVAVSRGTQAGLSAPAAFPGDVDSALAAAVASSVAADLSRGAGVDVDPASIGPGTRLVQLGTYDSAEAARAAWDALAQRFDPLLDDRGRVIEAAHSGGSVFYRLRAHGFADERDSRRFCAALIDQRLDCIPVLIR